MNGLDRLNGILHLVSSPLIREFISSVATLEHFYGFLFPKAGGGGIPIPYDLEDMKERISNSGTNS